jgi:predicted Zn finger-like uncharacterized protein
LNFSCNQCQRRYSIADEKVRGKTVKVRCKNCQNVISVEGPPLEVEESTRVVSLADVERLREQDRSLAEEEEAAAVGSTAVAQAEPAPGEQSPWDDEPTRTMPLQETGTPWFAMVRGKQEGPLEESTLRELMSSGAITPRTYFWQQGMADWKRGADIPELVLLFAEVAPQAAPSPVQAAPTTETEPEQPEPSPSSRMSWQPEPTQPASQYAAGEESSTPWSQQEEEPTPAPGGTAPLGELFSDLELPQSGQGQQEETGPAPEQEDPLAALGDRNERTPVKNTQYFVKKAGVDRRNPPWKIALFVVLLVGVPVGLLYLLTEMQVVPLTVTRVDAQGRAVEQPVSVFSAEGMGELRELLLGNKKPPPAVPRVAPSPEAGGRPVAERKAEPPASEEDPGEEDPALKELYAAADGKQDQVPEVRQDTEVAAPGAAGQSGPSPEMLTRVVSKSQRAFQGCIEQALRKNPRKFRGGRLLITATVGSSGKVKTTVFDRPDIEGSEAGECIKARARRMVFPTFEGEDVDVEIPLVLTRSL